VNRKEFKHNLRLETMCGIQHTGWTCGTCFFTMSDTLTNSDWQNLLLYRGDYTEDQLDNLPKDKIASLNKIKALIK
jgi:hypothetical protein